MSPEPLVALLLSLYSMLPQGVRLDATRCHFFVKFNYTWTEYLALSKSGRYLWTDSEHMAVGVRDQGRWRQLPTPRSSCSTPS